MSTTFSELRAGEEAMNSALEDRGALGHLQERRARQLTTGLMITEKARA
jgi:hypothetical protein